ncbi:DoxX family membrane protein [Polaribacter ponticola]|uniref:DoxX family membrane protein n=1 Tax=Polaribacter ponticola TaxID=2978475 RepID=A0ABT5S8L7_9FLAO|nr:DoxX family membrane protein [Polaribacter sp. MSW5]MDD7914451.1 DoxX family membrane protein [Polaribacter sp. MSW5]
MNSNVQLVKNILKYTFGLVPIVAGLDKFTNILTDWSQYISEGFAGMLPFEPTTFMMIVGVIEVIAGVLVLTKTKIGAYVVSAWLVGIALTLIFSWSYVDVAVRDLVMAIAAFSLAKLYEDNQTIAKN